MDSLYLCMLKYLSNFSDSWIMSNMLNYISASALTRFVKYIYVLILEFLHYSVIINPHEVKVTLLHFVYPV